MFIRIRAQCSFDQGSTLKIKMPSTASAIAHGFCAKTWALDYLVINFVVSRFWSKELTSLFFWFYQMSKSILSLYELFILFYFEHPFTSNQFPACKISPRLASVLMCHFLWWYLACLTLLIESLYTFLFSSNRRDCTHSKCSIFLPLKLYLHISSE